MDLKDNAIEWFTGSKWATVSLTQKKYINRVLRMAEKCPERVIILSKNQDGSLYARISLSAVHLTIYGSKTGRFAGVEEEAENE